MSFLPDNYEIPSAPGQFMKLEEGEHKFRVLDSAITGSEYWTEDEQEDGSVKKTPHRVKPSESIPAENLDPDNLPRNFWAFPVWNYADKRIQTLQLTQKTIMKAIMSYVKDEDYGDPQNYDLTIKRTGRGKETEYTVIAKPPKILNEAIIAEYESLKKSGQYDINRLYVGEYPLSKESAKNKDSNGKLDHAGDEDNLDDLPL